MNFVIIVLLFEVMKFIHVKTKCSLPPPHERLCLLFDKKLFI